MYITIQNEYFDREPENGVFYVCGYIQVDNEKPMKIQGIRFFEVNDGYHTIRYFSKHPSSTSEFTDSVSREFKSNDWVNIKVYARSYGIERAPDIDINSDIPEDMVSQLDKSCSACREMIQESYEKAKNTIRNARYNHPDWPKSFLDDWEKGALTFIDSVDRRCCLATEEFANWKPSTGKSSSSSTSSSSGGCYVATCVYGSYDCPEVWMLRRFRDNTLASAWYGRAFIRIYYAISPTVVKCFGKTKWFTAIFKSGLDKLVEKLRSNGVDDTPYNDKPWK